MSEKNEIKRVNYASSGVASIVLVGLFAAITYLGIQFFRIPLPAAVGAPFIHFGNSLVVLAVLFLGFYKGAIAGSIGLGIFDVLNGYAAEAPIIIIEVFVVALVVTQSFRLVKYNDSKILNITLVAVAAGVTKVILSFIEGVIKLLLGGSGLGAAVTSSFLSLPATVINSISTVIIVSLLYIPVKKALEIFLDASES
ncbi:membrane protein [Liquorilactobacillus sucicola DSM 21376 = JCM 15457]|uniref:Membrane protein n=1 Tax=Liquorilactobacillus sucicola DSM 21376 = JCM 15457 TaxID=1423806 RepID=A0A0R2DRT8_9LACO|nr:ECF transporter S component [Liquorilactobacillus sucicola]KRN06246.1 membrane protein [Liquorilactobacillus sucicola DSM 21376 = JCM 15457]